MKVTVLYSHPTSPEQFEKYYATVHMPIAAKMKGLERLELTKFIGGPEEARLPFTEWRRRTLRPRHRWNNAWDPLRERRRLPIWRTSQRAA